MIGMPAQFRRDRYAVIKPPLHNWLQRALPHNRVGEQLFVYYAILEGNFVVGMWADRQKTLFWDVINMGPALTFSMDDALHLRRLFCDPLTRSALSRKVQSTVHTETLALQNRERDFAEYARWSQEQGKKVQVSLSGI